MTMVTPEGIDNEQREGMEPAQGSFEEESMDETPEKTEVSLQTKEEFESRVEKLCQLMDGDPTVRDRLLAEMYVNMANAEMGIRGVFEMIQSQGISGMMRGAFRRGK